MWAVFVVIDQPLMRDRLDLFEVCEQVSIEHFRTVRAIEPFDKSILVGLARLDISDGNPFASRPLRKRSRDHFRPII